MQREQPRSYLLKGEVPDRRKRIRHLYRQHAENDYKRALCGKDGIKLLSVHTVVLPKLLFFDNLTIIYELSFVNNFFGINQIHTLTNFCQLPFSI